VKHEEAVKKVHPGACEFRPVRNLVRAVIGWTFEIPRMEDGQKIGASVDYGWVTEDAEVSSDKLGNVWAAQQNLRAYRSVKRQRPVNVLEKRA
jgi:hypothetical protein